MIGFIGDLLWRVSASGLGRLISDGQVSCAHDPWRLILLYGSFASFVAVLTWRSNEASRALRLGLVDVFKRVVRY